MNTTIITLSDELYIGDIFFFMPIIVITLLLDVSLNMYVITLLLSPGLGEFDAAEVFTLNQAISEILFAIMGPYLCFCYIYNDLCYFKPLGFIVGLCMSARPVIQCCVCLEHYLAVVHPVIFLRYRLPRYRKAHSLMAWTTILVFIIVCTVTYPKMPYAVFAALFMLILTVDFFCCMSILKKLNHPGPGERGEREMNSFKRKAFQVVVTNLLTFCIQILPIAVTFGVKNDLLPIEFIRAMAFNVTINTITGVVQPVFVLHKTGKLSVLRFVCFPKTRTP